MRDGAAAATAQAKVDVSQQLTRVNYNRWLIHVNHRLLRPLVRAGREDGEVFSVELIPDAELDRAVRDDWDRLLAADLPSAGRNPAPSNRPHITLAVRDRLEPSAFAGVAALLPVPVELGGVVLLGHKNRYVLARHVVVSAPLLALHRAVAELAGRPEPHYSNTGIDRWTPHMTLARGLSADRLATAMRLIKAPNIVGQATSARVWDAETRTVTTLG